MSSITYQSFSPRREVRYTPRTADQAPTASVEVGKEQAREAFMANLYSPGNDLPPLTSLVRRFEVSGLAADVVADMWERYSALRSAVAEAQNPAEQWTAWASGKLAVRGAVEAPASMQRKWLLTELASQETTLRQTYGSDKARLHPVAAAMRDFMYGQEQLVSLNGSTPNRELLPEAAFANPVEVIGMLALDLAQQPDLAEAN